MIIAECGMYVLGVGKNTPNLAVMGDTGEIPLLYKGFRLMLNYWHRLHALPNESLAKKALIENVQMRTTWIRTIEKLLNLFQITYSENNDKFNPIPGGGSGKFTLTSAFSIFHLEEKFF